MNMYEWTEGLVEHIDGVVQYKSRHMLILRSIEIRIAIQDMND